MSRHRYYEPEPKPATDKELMSELAKLTLTMDEWQLRTYSDAVETIVGRWEWKLEIAKQILSSN